MHRRVVITGMGVLSPIGNSVDEFSFGLKNGHNGIGPITHFDTKDYSIHIAGEVLINLEEKIAEFEEEMREAAESLEFERAAELRDRITELRQKMEGKA